jgi:hypothetical protein
MPPLSEPDTADAESFLEDMLLIFPILGVNVFEPRQQTASTNRLHLKGPNAQAEGAEADDGFLVFSGALARAETVESFEEWTKGWARLRESLIESNALIPVEGGASLRLTTDHVFKSPSAAAARLGRSGRLNDPAGVAAAPRSGEEQEDDRRCDEAPALPSLRYTVSRRSMHTTAEVAATRTAGAVVRSFIYRKLGVRGRRGRDHRSP